jgi:hypothetical protein
VRLRAAGIGQPSSPHASRARRPQRGGGLIAVLLIVAVLGAAGLLAQGDLATMARTRAQTRSMVALAQARTALLGYAVSYAERHPGEGYGYLPCPDANNSGSTPIGACGARGLGAIGRLPYRTLGLADIRDGWGQCLWYAVAGSVKHNPKALALNWDSPGQFHPRAASGTALTPDDARIVAVVFAPGVALERQSRPASSGRRCPGSDSAVADLAHFLDEAYPTAAGSPIDIFQGTADGLPRNDLIAWISVDELFGALRRRSDFAPYIGRIIDTAAAALASRLDDSDFVGHHATPAGELLIGELPSAAALALPTEHADAHGNWRDQFRFALCGDGSACIAITRDGLPGAERCRGALLFGGERVRHGTGRQARNTAAERADASQYFEGTNAEHLRDGVPAFSGAHEFRVPDADQPATQDVIRCLT